MTIKLSEHFDTIKLIKFTLPTIGVMIFYSLYAIVDGVFVSNFAGKDAFVAINIICPMIIIFSSVGSMIGTGGSALVSKVLGEEKKEKAKRYFSMLIYFEILVGILLGVIGVFISRPLAKLIGAKDEILELSVVYSRISCISLPFYILQNSFQSFMVTAERPNLGLLMTVVAGLSNIFFDFVFVYLLDMGIKGAAIATAICQVMGGSIPVIYFIFNKTTNIRLVFTKFEFDAIGKACLNGISEMMTNTSASFIEMLYQYQLMRIVGPDGSAAFGVIAYICFIYTATYMGFSNGMSPIVGYHYGAQNTDEIQSLFKKSLRIIFVLSLILCGIAEGLAGVFAGFFVGYHGELYHMTVKAMRIYSLAYLIMGYNVFTSAFFTGLNNGLLSACISFSKNFVFQIIMIFLLPVFFDLNGIWMSITCAEMITLIFVTFTILVYNRKKYNYI